jgi:hypothetical protein
VADHTTSLMWELGLGMHLYRCSALVMAAEVDVEGAQKSPVHGEGGAEHMSPARLGASHRMSLLSG